MILVVIKMDKNKTVEEVRVARIEELYRGLNPNQREFLRARFPAAKNDAQALEMLAKNNKAVHKRTVSWWKVHEPQFKECYDLMMESVQAIGDQVQHDNIMEASRLAGEEMVKLLHMPWYTVLADGRIVPLDRDLAVGKIKLIEHLTGGKVRKPEVSEPQSKPQSIGDITSLEVIPSGVDDAK